MTDEILSNDNPGTPTQASTESPEVVAETAGEGRDEQGRWVKGVSGNPEGAKPWTEEEKIKRRAIKDLVEEYKQGLAEALNDIKPILIKKALEGDVPAIKEINDRAMGKAQGSIDVTSGGKPIIQVAGEIAVKNKLYDPDASPKPDSE